jgi:hypothetical protein
MHTRRAHQEHIELHVHRGEEKRSAKRGGEEGEKTLSIRFHTCKRQKPKPAYGDDLHLDLVTVSDEAVDCLCPFAYNNIDASDSPAGDFALVCGFFISISREMHERLG